MDLYIRTTNGTHAERAAEDLGELQCPIILRNVSERDILIFHVRVLKVCLPPKCTKEIECVRKQRDRRFVDKILLRIDMNIEI